MMKKLVFLLLIVTDLCFAREFCESKNYTDSLWNRNRVQEEVFLAASEIRTDIFSAYMASYIPMTRERDKERCAGSLSSDSQKRNLIGDHLADIMSRFHISYTLRCIENPSWNSNSSSFCADYRRVTQNDMNSLSAMLLASATYLSSHMATSLAALIHDDNFWSTYPGHRLEKNKKLEYEKREKEIRNYKKLYDKNNPFLAQSLSTVVTSLEQGCYINSKTMNIASSLIEKLNLTEYVFKIVRDETFKVALRVAFEQSPQMHPMISTDRQTGRNYVDFDKLDYWTREPKSLRNHKRNTALLLHPPGFQYVTKSLGGLAQSDFHPEHDCSLTAPLHFDD